jgi:isopentenyl diphosphate isomerase/L-lactate dehydrogenase-like FMN-dependent dehydrogenase
MTDASALALAGEAGVRELLRNRVAEMGLAGCRSVAEAVRAGLVRAGPLHA